jgi:putative spermidine/putrescine transport system permease protein
MPDSAAQVLPRDGSSIRPAPRRMDLAWLGLLPFLLFVTAFLFLPIGFLIIGSFQNAAGDLTLQNYVDLGEGQVARAYINSIEISAVTAIAGGILGFLLAYAVILGRLPRFLRTAVMTFSGVASNFAGVPLALAFIFTIGQIGFVTVLLKNLFGWDLWRDGGFNLYSKIGLEIVYLYFQFPLMVLIIAPAIDGLRKEWREASENLGATGGQYWRHIGFPILLPSILGCVILLFGNAFGAQATAYQLTSGQIPIVTLLIGIQISGDVLHNVGLGYAMAMGMVVIMAISIAVYTVLQRRSERWLRS